MSKEKSDELKQKLEEADDSPEHSEIMPSSPPTQQDNLEEPEGVDGNKILEAAV